MGISGTEGVPAMKEGGKRCARTPGDGGGMVGRGAGVDLCCTVSEVHVSFERFWRLVVVALHPTAPQPMGILGTEGVPAMKEGGKRWENIVSVCGPQDVWARGGGDGGCCKGSLGVRYIHSMRDYVSHHASQWLVVVCHLYF
jgi:hypothetical protein